jgi:hypothetical protein
MPNLQLDWQQGGVLAAVLAVSAVVASRLKSHPSQRVVPYLREAAIIAALYSLWQLAAAVSVFGTQGAFDRARWIVRFQRHLGLPREQSIQSLVIHHPLVEQASNLFYASMHFGGLGIFLCWLFIRHRSHYPMVRSVLVLLTSVCLAIQLLPVAPPRLLPDLGFVDTAVRDGQSVYQLSGVTVDSLSAMPSVHIGWALLVAWAVIRVSPSRYRWWVLAHPILTVFVVVATANHFWLDGIVAALLLTGSIAAVRSGYQIIRRSNPPVPARRAEPAYR